MKNVSYLNPRDLSEDCITSLVSIAVTWIVSWQADSEQSKTLFLKYHVAGIKDFDHTLWKIEFL